MDKIEFKNTLEKFAGENTLIQKIQQKLTAIPNIQNLRYDVEVLKYIANVVENELKTHTEEEKKAIIVRTVKGTCQAWSLLDDAMILGQITFLSDNKQVKKISWKKYIYKSVGGWVSRRLS